MKRHRPNGKLSALVLYECRGGMAEGQAKQGLGVDGWWKCFVESRLKTGRWSSGGCIECCKSGV